MTSIHAMPPCPGTRTRPRRWLARLARGLLLGLLWAPLTLSAAGAERSALVIGNERYAKLVDLANAGRDARAIAARLEGLGFAVTLVENASRREFFRALDGFESRLAAGGTGVVFYAGHGVQARGVNYLIPTDAEIEIEGDLESEAIDAGRILESMARAGNPLNILILDACRDNPLPTRTRSATRGLTVTSIPAGAKGTAILYAAGEGQVADDGPAGGNGIFTAALLDALDRPNLSLEQVIKKVTRDVLGRTNGRQRPWSLASIQGDFYFNPKQATDAPVEATAPAPVQVTREAMARDVWQAIKESTNPQLLDDFRQRFGDTPYAMAAAARIAALTPAAPALAPTPDPQEVAALAVPTRGGGKYGPHDMVAVAGGCYTMGSRPGSPGHQTDEIAHQVCVDAFLVDRHEVTFEAYDAFAAATGRARPDDDGMGRGQRPVINIDWDDAEAYAQWASAQYGLAFRLPTEAEWEYACRAGGHSLYCGGDDAVELAVHKARTTEPVGSRRANAFGLHDMSGNTWEITCSAYMEIDFSRFGAMPAPGYDGNESRCAKGASQTTRVFRGGSWQSAPAELRAAARRYNYPGGSAGAMQHLILPAVDTLGFRLVAQWPPATTTRTTAAGPPATKPKCTSFDDPDYYAFMIQNQGTSYLDDFDKMRNPDCVK